MAADAIASADIQPEDIAAIGVTNQRETTLVWERTTGKPICNAIVWQDRRTAAVLRSSQSARPRKDSIQQKDGSRVDAYFSATKLQWILDHVPGARAGGAGELAFGTIDSWLVWNLTDGRPRHRRANASRTMLFNLHTGEWDDELLRLLGVPRAMLPRCVPAKSMARPPGSFGGAFPSPASRATSRRRCSVRVARARHGQEHLRHRLFHADAHRRPSPSRRRTSCSPPSRGESAAAPNTRSKAASSSPARWCNGCAMGWASSNPPARSKRLAAECSR